MKLGLPSLQMATKNEFWSSILQQSKNFSHQAYGSIKCLIANLATTEKFQSPSNTPPPSNGNWIFLVVQESKGGGGGGDPFFQEWYYIRPPFLGTKKFQSPFNIPPLLNDNWNFLTIEKGGACVIILGKKKSSLFSLLGNQRISIAIQWCGCVKWKPNFFGCLEGGTRDGNQNLRSPSNTPSRSNGDQNFNRHKGVTKFFWLPYLVPPLGWPKKFSRPSLWQPKKFGRHPTITTFWMAIEFFQLPQKGGCQMFLESFHQNAFKACGMPPFLATKTFNCHLKNCDN